MLDQTALLVLFSVLCMALLYSTVGHGGGSGYLAVLALAGFAPSEMRSIALILNVFVASIATWNFSSTSVFRTDLLFPLVIASIPTAIVGGFVVISTPAYNPIVGGVLLLAAIRLFAPISGGGQSKSPNPLTLFATGGAIGFFSGIVGIGGGVFLSPLVLLLGWATTKQTAAISAPFILLNSLAAIVGIAFSEGGVSVEAVAVFPLIVAVVVGGMMGSLFGSRRLGNSGIRRVLGIVLLIAAMKMFLAFFNSTPQPDTPAAIAVTSIS